MLCFFGRRVEMVWITASWRRRWWWCWCSTTRWNLTFLDGGAPYFIHDATLLWDPIGYAKGVKRDVCLRQRTNGKSTKHGVVGWKRIPGQVDVGRWQAGGESSRRSWNYFIPSFLHLQQNSITSWWKVVPGFSVSAEKNFHAVGGTRSRAVCFCANEMTFMKYDDEFVSHFPVPFCWCSSLGMVSFFMLGWALATRQFNINTCQVYV